VSAFSAKVFILVYYLVTWKLIFVWPDL